MSLLRRRDFLLTSSAAAGAVLFAGCVPPQSKMTAESRVLLAEDILSAYDTWYATTCRGCEAACGAVVRVVDGRARKVEGNPDHPVNLGKLCARGQALVQEQYHPDRIRGPLQRDASVRGQGRFQSISWGAALDGLVGRLGDLLRQGRAADVTLITRPLGAHQAFVVDRFARSYGLKWLPFEPVPESALHEAVRRVFGLDQLPHFDVQHARTVLSFGADFLSTWLSPVRFGLEYGIFRQGSYDVRAFQPRPDGPRGRLIHVETHFSATAASADEWVWVRPGAEGVLALSIGQALGASGLEAYAPEQTAAATGVAADRVRRIARELAQATPSLVIGGGTAGGYTHGTEALVAILGLNRVLGNVGQPGGVQPSPPAPVLDLPARAAARPLADWRDLVSRMNDGREQAVLVLGGANPVYGLPRALGFSEAMQRVPFVASFNSFPDETTNLTDLVLPSSLPLEEWGDAVPEPGVGGATLSLQQPVVQSVFDTRSVWDVLLAVADELGDPMRQALPWPTFKDVLQDQLRGLGAWNSLLQRGVYAASSLAPEGGSTVGPGTTLTTPGGSALPPTPSLSQGGGELLTEGLPQPVFDGDPGTYPFVLVPFVHNTLGAGEGAHLPWLQAAPDPVTSVTWQTWVELNPRLAAELGVAEGDIVAVESTAGRVEAPAYLSPAAPPEVIAMPLGQGHTGSGRWASGRGANVLDLLAPLVDTSTGALASSSTRVRLTRTDRHIPLPKLEGLAPARQLPGSEVLKVMHT